MDMNRKHLLSVKAFPAHERFELGSQIRRAAEASLAETGHCIHVAGRLGYLTPQQVDEIELEIRKVGAPLVGLIRATRVNVTAQLFGATVLIVIGPTWLS